MTTHSPYLAVEVKPRSSRDEVVGRRIDDSGLATVVLRVRAAPDGGKANKAVVQLVAKSLSIPPSAVSVIRGHTSRHKLLALSCDQGELDAWCEALTVL